MLYSLTDVLMRADRILCIIILLREATLILKILEISVFWTSSLSCIRNLNPPELFDDLLATDDGEAGRL